jgi:hypothetical protein
VLIANFAVFRERTEHVKLWCKIGIASVTAAGLVAFVAAPASAHGGKPNTHKHKKVHIVRPGGSIQNAVDAASPGDTILLKKGNYAGGILISKDNITVRGAGRSTVLTDSGTNHCGTGEGAHGFCVINPAGGVVRGVTIKNLQVKGFAGFGVFGLRTDTLTVKSVAAINNGEYGIAEFESTRGAFVGNYVADTVADAGLYVGDIADARGTVVAHNVSVNNALGVLVRHARNVTVSDNKLVGNCVGVALVDDGQAGGQGDTRVTNNVINANNRHCAATDDVPELGGSGVIILGGEGNSIRGNTIVGNSGTTALSGGVVLVPGVAGNPAENNVIKRNKIKNNQPADIIDQSGSTTNVFKQNRCQTSQPAGLC